ncbi:hypothetical protein P4U99_02900 [Brevibacillus agri]|uniref:hypothetical protein n=1 Tax=Brevibacillus TaxID=55080 RepID=UPI002E23947D|nr:hypothetical protein [Brevibacillus agri]MED1654420.1 hypothetical protein [Brevibacillus agri]MED1688103.1 hypothetical protein [Brevibacillus agri]MED1691167.1 hypothetical protein [Brevibacillus agri]MED1699403.1 hypothetical protein [Brevibacillus agri]
MFLSHSNNKEIMQLPVPPASYNVPSPWNNEKVEGLQQSLNLIGLKGLRTVEIKSFFPIRDYPFLRNRSMWGMAYVDTIERWRELRVPIRLVIVDSGGSKSLNMPVTIDEFEWGVGRSGDIDYTLQMTEFTFVSTARR